MPPFLALSPCMMDQSFPKTRDDLLAAAVGLGEIQAGVERGDYFLVTTPVLDDFVESINWQQPGRGHLLGEIWHFLSRLLLQPNVRVRRISVHDVEGYQGHPIPEQCERAGLGDIWSDEMGRLLVIHDRNSSGSWFIGIACARAFAGELLCRYARHERSRCFPVVGPGNLESISDAWKYRPHPDALRGQITLRDVLKNVKVLGASEVDEPDGDSHYHVHFPRARPWVVDRNIDPVPEGFLRELVEKTGFPLPVIKHALKMGVLPPMECRI